jgi:sugar phosphate isomerase/epimerase
MKILFFCPMWGSDKIDFKLFLANVRQSGYDGVEMSLPEDATGKRIIMEMLEQNELKLIAQHWETLTPDFEKHRREYRSRIANLASAKPLFINSQTGKDYFSFEQNAELIAIADEVGAEYGVKVIHETHRGKFSFAPHITSDYLKKLTQLRLGLDVSHWCAVAESWLDDQKEALALALSRADHIHARVGFPEGPQIPDPRVPEWQDAVERHITWWKKVIDMRNREGWKEFTITPEFGPQPYMTHLPGTGEPIANQWDVNVFMMNHLRSSL